MKTVKEVSDLSGISVRTLHYYDKIGLLKPTKIQNNGYRYYDTAALGKLQEILFFRELAFPLKEIKEFMENPHYDREASLKKHITLLNLKKQRLDAIISLAKDALKGENIMEFKAFDDKEIKAKEAEYQKEARERWGDTQAYQESEEKAKEYTEAEWAAIRKEMDTIMYGFSALVGDNPAGTKAQSLVKQWQEHLTKYYYDCTKEILGCLGQMYTADERFTENIDVYGKGTAAFLSAAIAEYVK